MTQRRKCLPRVVIVAVSLILFSCFSSGDPADDQVSKEAIYGLLGELARNSKDLVAIAADRMRSTTDDPGIQRHAIQWQLSVVESTRYARGLPDARAGVLELWTRAHQMNKTMAGPFGEDFFGDQQAVAVEATKQIVEMANQIGRRMLGEAKYEKVLVQLKEFAGAHAIDTEISMGRVGSSGFLTGEGSAVAWVLSLPMKPFELGEGVGETAHSIQNVAFATERAIDVIDDMPQEVKLQMDLLLLDLERAKVITGAIDDLNRITTSIEGFEQTAATLPADVRREVSVVLDQIDTKQEDLRKTLEHARGLVAETNEVVSGAKQAIFEVNGAVAKTKETAEALEPVLVNLTAAGEAWEDTANAITRFMETVSPPHEEKKAPPAPAPKPVPAAAPESSGESAESVSVIVEIGDSAEKLTVTAVELRALTENLQEIIASDDLTRRLEDVDGLASGTVDHITWRAIQLFAVFFGLLFAYKFAAMKFLKAPTPRRAG